MTEYITFSGYLQCQMSRSTLDELLGAFPGIVHIKNMSVQEILKKFHIYCRLPCIFLAIIFPSPIVNVCGVPKF